MRHPVYSTLFGFYKVVYLLACWLAWRGCVIYEKRCYWYGINETLSLYVLPWQDGVSDRLSWVLSTGPVTTWWSLIRFYSYEAPSQRSAAATTPIPFSSSPTLFSQTSKIEEFPLSFSILVWGFASHSVNLLWIVSECLWRQNNFIQTNTSK
jgi:hypothetical protein